MWARSTRSVCWQDAVFACHSVEPVATRIRRHFTMLACFLRSIRGYGHVLGGLVLNMDCLGQIWPEISESWAIPANVWSESTTRFVFVIKIGPRSTQIGFVGLARISPDFGIWAISANICIHPASVGPGSTKFGRVRPNLGRARLNLREFGHLLAKLDQTGRFCPNLDNFWPAPSKSDES